MVESRAVFRRRRFHRAKAHLVLSAMRHRAAELGDQADLRAGRHLRRGAARSSTTSRSCHPTSYAALRTRRAARRLRGPAEPRGFATPREDFERWADGRGGKRLLMEDFYRWRAAAPTACSWTAASRPAGSGTSTTTTASRRPRARRRSASRAVVAGRGRHRREVREDLDRWERDGDVDVRRPRRPAPVRRDPRRRRWPRSTTSSSTGCRTSAPTRTRCSRPTRGWRTALLSAPR